MGFIDVEGLKKIKDKCEEEKRYAPDQFFLDRMMKGIKPIDRDNCPVIVNNKPRIKRRIK